MGPVCGTSANRPDERKPGLIFLGYRVCIACDSPSEWVQAGWKLEFWREQAAEPHRGVSNNWADRWSVLFVSPSNDFALL